MANLIKTLKQGLDYIFPRTTASAVIDSQNRTVEDVLASIENGKLSVYQGIENAGKTLVVGADGYLMLTGNTPRLPAEYQEVEWIQSQEYVDNDHCPSINTGISGEFIAELDLEIYPKSGVTNTPLIGQSTTGGQWFGADASGKYQLGGGHTLSNTDTTQRNSIVWTKTASNGSLTVGSYSDSRSGGTTTDPFYLFSAGANYNGNYYGKIKMYSAKITQNGSVVREFVPCYRKSDNAVGMYDLKTSTFFPNASTGAFTKGADV